MEKTSSRPLAAKLGLKPGLRAVVINPPPRYADLLAPLPEGVALVDELDSDERFVQLFTPWRRELAERLPELRAAMAPDGVIWVSWPKKAARLPGDLTEDVVRELGFSHGLVDVKVCAVDVIWSALKLVIRVRDRG